MQHLSVPPDERGFVVEWQLADVPGTVIDLSVEPSEAELLLPVEPPVRTGAGG